MAAKINEPSTWKRGTATPGSPSIVLAAVVDVDHCCISLFGGIQPSRLRAYLADALADGPSNDGLIQRFQLLVRPDPQPSWEYQDNSFAVAANRRRCLRAIGGPRRAPIIPLSASVTQPRNFCCAATELEFTLASGRGPR